MMRSATSWKTWVRKLTREQTSRRRNRNRCSHLFRSRYRSRRCVRVAWTRCVRPGKVALLTRCPRTQKTRPGYNSKDNCFNLGLSFQCTSNPTSWNPLDNLLELECRNSLFYVDPNTNLPRMCRTTMMQKIVDTFRVIGGSIPVTFLGMKGPIYYNRLDYKTNDFKMKPLRMGLLDYISFSFLFKLVNWWLLKDLERSEYNGMRGSDRYLVSLGFFRLISAIQYCMAFFFTALSLPVVGLIHVYSL